MKIDLKQNEMVVKAGDSDLLHPEEKVEGKFIVTNQRLYFKSFNGNGEKYDMEVEPAQIKEVHFFNTGFLSRNGLKIILRNGEDLSFRIKKRNAFGELINKMY